MRPIVEACVDRGSFFEIGKMWGRSVVTGLARLDGWPVAVLASDPFFYGGGWTADASHKVTRFVDLAETFHLPVVHFVDIPGFIIGVAGEKAATIRHGARALAAVYQSEGAVVLDPAAQVVRRGGRGAPELAEVQFPLRLAVGRLGLAAARGRHRGRLQGRARGVARSGGASRARSRRGSTRCARRSAPPSASASRRSSTRATRGACSASSPISPRRCASPARAASDTGREAVGASHSLPPPPSYGEAGGEGHSTSGAPPPDPPP